MRAMIVCVTLALLWATPSAAQTHAELQQSCEAEGRPDTVIAACTAAIEANAGSAEWLALAHRRRGVNYSMKGEADRALRDFTRATELNPLDADSFKIRADIYAARGEYERAFADIDEAMRLRPNNSAIISQRGEIYAKKGDFERAIQDYSAALAINANSAARLYRCDAHRRLGRLAEALADCDAMVALYSNYGAPFDYRGRVHLAAGRLDAAIADFSKAVSLDHHEVLALYGRGIARQRKGDAAGGAADIAAARERIPDIAAHFARLDVK